MRLRFVTTVVPVHLLCLVTLSQGLVTYFMDAQCNRLLNMTSKGAAIKVALTSLESYLPDMICQLSVSGQHGRQLLITFLEMNISQSDNCSLDAVRVFDGKPSRDLKVPGILGGQRLCGSQLPKRSLVTDRNYVTIRFTSHSQGQGSGFKLLISEFYTSGDGRCGKGDFACGNGRCVNASLICDEYDSCGDGSDSCQSSASFVVILVLAGVIAALLVLLIVVAFSYYLLPVGSSDARRLSIRTPPRQSVFSPSMTSRVTSLGCDTNETLCACAWCERERMDAACVASDNGRLGSQGFPSDFLRMCLPPYSPTPLPGEIVGITAKGNAVGNSQTRGPPPYSPMSADSLLVAVRIDSTV